METKFIVLFLIGILIGAMVVMLFWLSSPGCMMSSTLSGGTSDSLEVREYEPGTLIQSGEGGATIMTTGERGARSIFVDSSGTPRELICYTSVYCIDDTPCDEPCDECQDNGERCGFWPEDGSPPTLAANLPQNGKDYGECCPPYECMDGYCVPPEECVEDGDYCRTDEDCCEGPCINGICGEEEECVETGETCGYVPPTYTANIQGQGMDYGECCPPDECVNNVCTPPEECNDFDEVCGRVQDPTIMTHVAYTDYGECCPPYECVNNRCGYEEEECQEENEGCGVISYVTGSAVVEEDLGDCCEPFLCLNNVCLAGCLDTGSSCSSDNDCCEGLCLDGVCADCAPSGYDCYPGAGDCCEGYLCQDFKCRPEGGCADEGDDCRESSDCCDDLFCFDGECREEGECGEEGDTCGLGTECCEGLYCSDNDECVECAEIGDDCGGYAAPGLECCPGGYCYMGVCEESTDYLCEDDENGPDYYSQGSATGEYDGDYGTYTDFCVNDNVVADYYCVVNNDYSPIEIGTVTCPKGCSQGACN